MQLYIDKCTAWGERAACVTVFCCHTTWAATHHLQRILSISGGWMLLCKEHILTEDSPNINMHSITTFYCCLALHAGVS